MSTIMQKRHPVMRVGAFLMFLLATASIVVWLQVLDHHWGPFVDFDIFGIDLLLGVFLIFSIALLIRAIQPEPFIDAVTTGDERLAPIAPIDMRFGSVLRSGENMTLRHNESTRQLWLQAILYVLQLLLTITLIIGNVNDLEGGPVPGSFFVLIVVALNTYGFAVFRHFDRSRLAIVLDNRGIIVKHRWTQVSLAWNEILGWYVLGKRENEEGHIARISGLVLIGERRNLSLNITNTTIDYDGSSRPVDRDTERYVEDFHRLLATIVTRTGRWPRIRPGRSTVRLVPASVTKQQQREQ
jgi:hypothetical protein